MRVRRYVFLRILQFIPVVLAVIVINFVLIHIAPGDVAITLAGEDADPAYIEHIRETYGLNRPLYQQLITYLGQVLQGDLGISYRSREPVFDEILRRIPATLLLVGVALFLSVILGTAIGTLVASRPGRAVDTIASTAAIALYSIPVFWLGLMLVLLFAVELRWFPTSGMFSLIGPTDGLGRAVDIAYHLVLPMAALSTVWIGQYLRLGRTAVIQVLNEPYITTSRAIGFAPRTVLLNHALRNAMLPIITVLGLQIGLLLTGAVLTETVFSWPGLGRLIYEAILTRDTPLIMGAYVLMSIMVALASLLADLLYAYLDPRVNL